MEPLRQVSGESPVPTLDPHHRLGMPLPKRVAVFRGLQLGDLLCAVPALRALRAALPQARITLIGLPWARAFAERFAHYVDDFLEFPGAPGLPERTGAPAEYARFLEVARAANFDLAIQLHGSGEVSNSVIRQLGAMRMAGCYRPGGDVPDPERFCRYPDELPEVGRPLALLAFLGIVGQGDSLEFPILADEWRELAGLRASVGLRPGEYVCLHPGARTPARRWQAERFAQIGDRLAARGLRVVLTGTEPEADCVNAVARAMHSGCVNLVGCTSLGVLAALLTGARLLVCNDTGVAHVAQALRVPSIVVYTASDPARWAAADRERHRVVFHPVECRPCTHQQCPIGHPCASGVGVEAVWREVEALLG